MEKSLKIWIVFLEFTKVQKALPDNDDSVLALFRQFSVNFVLFAIKNRYNAHSEQFPIWNHKTSIVLTRRESV